MFFPPSHIDLMGGGGLSGKYTTLDLSYIKEHLFRMMKEKLCYVGYDIHAEQKLAQGEHLWTQFALVVLSVILCFMY